MTRAKRSLAARWTRAALLISVTLPLTVPALARAATLHPHWVIISTSAPTYFKAGDEGDLYELTAVNDGGTTTDGSRIVVTDNLPPGVSATVIKGEVGTGGHGFPPTPMTCPTSLSCETEANIPPGEVVRIKLILSVAAGGSGMLVNEATISGGGAHEASVHSSTRISPETVPFGATLATSITGEEGEVDTQSGSHTFRLTTILAFNVASVDRSLKCQESPGCPLLNADARDLDLQLPAGLVGSPLGVPRCTQIVFQTFGNNTCPADTQVGGIHLFFYGQGTATQFAPIYNVEPLPGQPAELGFTVGGSVHIPMFLRVRSDGDYGLTVQLSGISEADPFHIGVLTIWGVPAAPSHDGQRDGPEHCEEGCPSDSVAKPFLRLPTSCAGGQVGVPFSTDSWQEPDASPSLPPASVLGMTGCGAIPFSPSLAIQPDTLQSHSPTGYAVTLHVPQNEDPEGLASSDVRDLVVALPAGTVLSPSAANGLEVCTHAQFEPQKGATGGCPPHSDLGTVKIVTSTLEQPLIGRLFLGQPECSPCTPADAQDGRMVPLLLEAESAGVVLKLAGHTSVDQETGKLTATFDGAPQMPFESLEVHLNSGQDAPLVNPTACGPAIGAARLTPWSTPAATNIPAPAIPISGCSTSGFAPTLQAGMTKTAQAGAFSGFAVTLGRADGQQDLGSFTLTTPPGLLGMLSNVSPCGEAQANVGTCSTASEIGSTSATIGPGTQPYEIDGGRVFLTGPYRGQPFGLSIVVPSQAGPFQLAGNSGQGTVVVRASIAINPQTAALTISSDELPQSLNGIPLDISRIVVNLSREGFMFNPTNCNAMSIVGTVRSTTGTMATASFPFQSVNCATLPFKPKLAALTHAKTSKPGGADLHVRVVAGVGQANIAKIKVDLPRQLPARLTTLQQACPVEAFNANPASCPAASLVGKVVAVTPILRHALAGPAYLVSRGSATLPDVEVVLQGEGVTLVLDGDTQIKHGVTSSTWNSLPDTPISTFDLVLPQGRHSLLAANLPARAKRSMCRQRLVMPTAITGQNGAIVRQTTRIAVSGCARTRRARKSKQAHIGLRSRSR
jgi:hypothetical protein